MILLSTNPTQQAEITEIRPTAIKEWLKYHLPILVVPVLSKLTVAISDG
ncbi:Uncharacterised protein [Vibrio cholerae]|nr:Uncharacterised protein [Vibrio cholerae]